MQEVREEDKLILEQTTHKVIDCVKQLSAFAKEHGRQLTLTEDGPVVLYPHRIWGSSLSYVFTTLIDMALVGSATDTDFTISVAEGGVAQPAVPVSSEKEDVRTVLSALNSQLSAWLSELPPTSEPSIPVHTQWRKTYGSRDPQTSRDAFATLTNLMADGSFHDLEAGRDFLCYLYYRDAMKYVRVEKQAEGNNPAYCVIELDQSILADYNALRKATLAAVRNFCLTPEFKAEFEFVPETVQEKE